MEKYTQVHFSTSYVLKSFDLVKQHTILDQKIGIGFYENTLFLINILRNSILLSHIVACPKLIFKGWSCSGPIPKLPVRKASSPISAK